MKKRTLLKIGAVAAISAVALLMLNTKKRDQEAAPEKVNRDPVMFI